MSLNLKAVAKTLAATVASKGFNALVQSQRLIASVSSGLFLKILEKTDSFSVSDVLAKAFSRPTPDSFSVSDAEVKELGKNLSDIVSVTETQSADVGKSIADTFVVGDAIDLVDVGKNTADAGSASDEQQFDITKLLTDSIFVTDDVDGEASILDDQIMHFFKAKTDNGFASDQEVKLAGKVTSDSASSADSGSLISQGYTVDNTYFAEDYVGDSRTFT
jgi:hypothetical protein